MVDSPFPSYTYSLLRHCEPFRVKQSMVPRAPKLLFLLPVIYITYGYPYIRLSIFNVNDSMQSPTTIFKCLADDTRLRTMLLIAEEGELCVCELTCALDESQPKISRHLSQLRNCGLLEDQRQGQWVYYRLHPALPEWVVEVIQTTLNANRHWLNADHKRLEQMGDRPERAAVCC